MEIIFNGLISLNKKIMKLLTPLKIHLFASNQEFLKKNYVKAYEYYELALEMFDISLQAIGFEFTDQNFVGPKYKSFNGKAWSQLYYAGEFLEPELSNIRDSLRQESKIYFDQALWISK